MSTSASHHHGSAKVMLCFLAIGLLELIASRFVTSGALRGDGLHNVVDAGVFGAAGAAHRFLSGKGHAHQLTERLHCMFGPGAYGLGLLTAIPPYHPAAYDPPTLTAIRVLVALGCLSLLATFFCYQATSHHAGFRAHLQSDAIGAFTIIGTALTDSLELRGLAEGLALAGMVAIAKRELASVTRPHHH